jgi:hypothetical protein
MNRRDTELLDRQLSRLSPPRNDGILGLAVLVVFCIGIAVGGVLFAQHGSRSTASDMAAMTWLSDNPTIR